MNHVTALRAADISTEKHGGGGANSVIFVFLSAGLAQHDSFEPKPDAPAENLQRPENLAATIYHALGIPATAVRKDELDRPHHNYHGEPIRFS